MTRSYAVHFPQRSPQGSLPIQLEVVWNLLCYPMDFFVLGAIAGFSDD